MKYSKYNLVISDDSLSAGKCLVCNTLSGGTFLVDLSVAESITRKDWFFMTPLFTDAGCSLCIKDFIKLSLVIFIRPKLAE